MDPAVVAAAVTIIPGAITATFIGLRRLKKISHAVNGQMDARFKGLEARLDVLHAEVRDEFREIKAEQRDVKADLRAFRVSHFGDGK